MHYEATEQRGRYPDRTIAMQQQAIGAIAGAGLAIGQATNMQNVPADRPLSEIEAEMNRLRHALTITEDAFYALVTRLQCVRAEAPEGEALGSAEASPSTLLGSEIRQAAHRVETLHSVIEYQLRTVALPG